VSYDTQRPYAACYVLLEKAGKYAFLLRSNTNWMDGFYGLPAGKVEKGESASAGIIREAKEEVGITIEIQELEAAIVCHRKSEDDTDSWVDVVFKAENWIGEVINAEPTVHGRVDWFAYDGLPENIIPQVKFMLEQYIAGKTYCEYGW
jgi:8-oxo-dGTP diphosphatase